MTTYLNCGRWGQKGIGRISSVSSKSCARMTSNWKSNSKRSSRSTPRRRHCWANHASQFSMSWRCENVVRQPSLTKGGRHSQIIVIFWRRPSGWALYTRWKINTKNTNTENVFQFFLQDIILFFVTWEVFLNFWCPCDSRSWHFSYQVSYLPYLSFLPFT